MFIFRYRNTVNSSFSDIDRKLTPLHLPQFVKVRLFLKGGEIVLVCKVCRALLLFHDVSASCHTLFSKISRIHTRSCIDYCCNNMVVLPYVLLFSSSVTVSLCLLTRRTCLSFCLLLISAFQASLCCLRCLFTKHHARTSQRGQEL